MTKRSKRRLDLNQLAKRIANDAVDEPGMIVRSRRVGRAAGGYARMLSLTKNERIDLARFAANARWKKKL